MVGSCSTIRADPRGGREGGQGSGGRRPPAARRRGRSRRPRGRWPRRGDRSRRSRRSRPRAPPRTRRPRRGRADRPAPRTRPARPPDRRLRAAAAPFGRPRRSRPPPRRPRGRRAAGGPPPCAPTATRARRRCSSPTARTGGGSASRSALGDRRSRPGAVAEAGEGGGEDQLGGGDLDGGRIERDQRVEGALRLAEPIVAAEGFRGCLQAGSRRLWIARVDGHPGRLDPSAARLLPRLPIGQRRGRLDDAAESGLSVQGSLAAAEPLPPIGLEGEGARRPWCRRR